MPQQTSTFESHFLTHMQDVAGAYHKLIACSWVPILQVGGLGKVRVNCFPKAITTWLGRESNPRPPDPESDALTTLPRCLVHTTLSLYQFVSALLFYTTQSPSIPSHPFFFSFLVDFKSQGCAEDKIVFVTQPHRHTVWKNLLCPACLKEICVFTCI